MTMVLPTAPSTPCSHQRKVVAPASAPETTDAAPIVSLSSARRTTASSSVRSVTEVSAVIAAGNAPSRRRCRPAGCVRSGPTESFGSTAAVTVSVTGTSTGATPAIDEPTVMVAV